MTILAGWCTLLAGIIIGVAGWSLVLIVVLLIRESNWSPWKAIRYAVRSWRRSLRAWVRYWWLRGRGRCTVCGGILSTRIGPDVYLSVDVCRWCRKREVHAMNYGAHR